MKLVDRTHPTLILAPFLGAIFLASLIGCKSRGFNSSNEPGSGAGVKSTSYTKCNGGLTKVSNPGARIEDIQQTRNASDTSIPSKAFNDRIASGAFSRPVTTGIPMAHRFYKGNSPITGYPHEGLDYSGVGDMDVSEVENKPIHAITDGVIAFAMVGCPEGSELMCGDGWGNHVVIDHGGSVFSRYAHIKPGTIGVDVGQSVKKGDVIGKVGMSGYTMGPHLHLEIGTMDPGATINACKPTMFSQVYNPWIYLENVDNSQPQSGATAQTAAAPAAPSVKSQLQGKVCTISASPAGTDVNIRDKDGNIVGSVPDRHGSVKIRGFIQDMASVEVTLPNGQKLGKFTDADEPAFIHVTQFKPSACNP